MRSRTAGTLGWSLLGGLLVSGAGILIPLFGWALAPGMIVSWAIFPKGIETGVGHRGGSFAAVLLGSAVFWAAVLLPVIAIKQALGRRRREPKAASKKEDR